MVGKGKGKRIPVPCPKTDWPRIYAIYGIDHWHTLAVLLLHASLFSLLSLLFLLFFDPVATLLQSLLSSSPTAARSLAGFAGAFTALSAVLLFLAAGNFFYSAAALPHEVAQRMVGAVGDWSAVRNALDVGCGRGILLNAVATQLKKSGSSGRVVGLAQSKRNAMATLRTAKMEGVQEYVTCREGDARSLPFPDDYFDVVVSAVFLQPTKATFPSKQHSRAGSAENWAERARMLGEIVRVLKPGGVAVVWDFARSSWIVKGLQELKMADIRGSEQVTAFMTGTHVVSFTKPAGHAVLSLPEVRLDWGC
ncbi:hypothetical protein MLD38_000511 [Melastoma candidum]|uniref:Uncharacterized protein n=1 Tax=Melastoma candidum TaxID=119954 RepID=A0ACB9S9U5_9MYRT|nr:hypothetical protein MLD38_000511 [Melastoma candidum]